MKRLLAVFAHPDDECFGPAGGTLAKYAAEGVQVHIICATRGEAGTIAPEILANGRQVEEARTEELNRAASKLGVTNVHYLNYRDSGMAGAPDNFHPRSLINAPLHDVAEHIAALITTISPDVIITHDEFGWYGHPDHIKCYQAVLQAYDLLYGLTLCSPEASQPARTHVPALYVATFPKWPVKLATLALRLRGRDPRRCGQNQDVDLMKIASWHVPTTARINVTRYLDQKRAAMLCHASQKPLTQSSNWFMQSLLNRIETQETLCRLYPAPDNKIERDLGIAVIQPVEKRATGTMPAIAGI